MNLLVVDWDYFFPVPQGGPEVVLYDWGHTEMGGRAMLEGIWHARAAGFVGSGRVLPGLSGLELGWWPRFRFSPKATLYVAESNAQAASKRVAANITSVWLFDAHHDAGYHQSDGLRNSYANGFTAEDWLAWYYLEGVVDLHVRYPQWRTRAFDTEPEPAALVDRAFDREAPVPLVFDRVFICRSGVWVPPWHDGAFDEFVAACPVKRRRVIGQLDDSQSLLLRYLDMGHVEQIAGEALKAMEGEA